MVGASIVQVGSAVRHTPLPQLAHETESPLNSEDLTKDLSNIASQFPVLGGFIGDGQLAWRAIGPTVEIVEPYTGTRKAAWTFGAILHNIGTRVTSVCGVGPGAISQVVVGVDLGVDYKPQGMAALLSLSSSRLTRVFHFTHKVTSLCMVSGGEVSVDSGTLAPELRSWHGLLVVGTSYGTLHLIDLALDLGGHKVLSDEVSPGNLVSVATPDPQAERNRINSVMQNCHPTMCLSDSMTYGGQFQLIGPDDSVLFETSGHLVSITALTFIPQLASLVVGYNFGAFQIINLSTLTIDCASPYEESMPPVHSFSWQEPENDPKNFVYLWLCRSWGPTEAGKRNRSRRGSTSHALCTMYAMNYDNKVWIEGHGLWYQGLASISPRFEFDAIGGLGSNGEPTEPSRVFSAMTVRQTTPTSAAAHGGSSSVSALATPDEESGPVPEQSLCLFGWIGGSLEEGHVSINHYLAVFDINQWYQAQMPPNLKLEKNHLCPYMSFHVLDRVPGNTTNGGQSEIVLSAAAKPASWSRHMSRTCNESDWFPAALSYDAHVLTSEGLVEYRCQSAQQAALGHLTTNGPSAIVSPEDAYAMCVFAGLVSPDTLPAVGSAMVKEREALLNVALDQQLVSLLVQCVAEFSEGRFTNLGCSLPSLLEWSWSRVSVIKATNDNLCMPLFDPECGVMSPESITSLHQNLTSLASLTTIITTIRNYANTNMITLQGAGELESRVQVVSLLMLHLSVVLWFYHCGLLFHTPTEDVTEECHVPFPADLLCRIYKNRRSEIHHLSSSLVGNEVLLIDGLLEETAGGSNNSIGKAWEKDGGSGMYPPPSLHALLSMFTLPDVSTTTKHRIVQYLFLDLASLLSDGYVRVVEELVKYPSSFSLSPSHIKLTQAFWLLDHKDFQEGLNVLLDPLVSTNDITTWQHRRIMKAFLYQGEHSRALTYAQIRQPPKADLDDIRLHLTLLLANGLIREAFHYQRTHRIKNNSEDLLNHLFTGCEQLGKLECVIHLPLSPLEEEVLVSYLQTSANTSAYDYLLVYYLQRARYDEAAALQESLRGGLGTAKKRQGARSALVHGYLTHLPDVAKRITCGPIRNVGSSRTIYTKPQPLSAQIRQAAPSLKSHTANINKMLDTSLDAWSSVKSSPTPYTPFRNKAQRRKVQEQPEIEEITSLFTPKRNNSARDLSHVVFPSRVQASHSRLIEDEEGEIGLFRPAKRSRLGESFSLHDDMSVLIDSVVRKTTYGGPDASASIPQNISSDLMLLLQTPKIMRKRKSEVQPGVDSSLVDTPQSILKVRQMVQRPLSPAAASDTSIPVFPQLNAKKASEGTAQDTLLSRANDASMTPKQLRFHLPKMRMDEEPVDKKQTGNEIEGPIVVADLSVASTDEEVEEEEEREMHSEEETDIEEQYLRERELEEGEVEAKKTKLWVIEKTEEVIHKSTTISSRPNIHNLKTNPLRHPDSGVPTPRQPLRSYGAKATNVSPVLHESNVSECVDEMDAKKDPEYSFEYPNKNTTAGEVFYSFTEEEPPGAEVFVDDAKIVSEDLGSEDELEGAERSKEAEESEAESEMMNDLEDSRDGVAERSREVGDSEEDNVFVGKQANVREELQCENENYAENEKDNTVKPQKVSEKVDSEMINVHEEGVEKLEVEDGDLFKEVAERRPDGKIYKVQHSPIIRREEIFILGKVDDFEKTEHHDDSFKSVVDQEAEENTENKPSSSLNESEVIPSLEFSDSESEPEEKGETTERDNSTKEKLIIDTSMKEETELSVHSQILITKQLISSKEQNNGNNLMEEESVKEKPDIDVAKSSAAALNMNTCCHATEKKGVSESTVLDDEVMNTDCQITEEEEEMIDEAMSEKDKRLSLNTSEHISPLHLSDSESEDDEEKYNERHSDQIGDHCDREASLQEPVSEESESISLDTSEHISPLRFSDSESEDEGENYNNGRHADQIEDHQGSETSQDKVNILKANYQGIEVCEEDNVNEKKIEINVPGKEVKVNSSKETDRQTDVAVENEEDSVETKTVCLIEAQGDDTSSFEITCNLGEVSSSSVHEERTNAVPEDNGSSKVNGRVCLEEDSQISKFGESSQKTTESIGGAKLSLAVKSSSEVTQHLENEKPKALGLETTGEKEPLLIKEDEKMQVSETDERGSMLKADSEDIEIKSNNRSIHLGSDAECDSQLLAQSLHKSVKKETFSAQRETAMQQKEPVVSKPENNIRITLDRNGSEFAEETSQPILSKRGSMHDAASTVSKIAGEVGLNISQSNDTESPSNVTEEINLRSSPRRSPRQSDTTDKSFSSPEVGLRVSPKKNLKESHNEVLLKVSPETSLKESGSGDPPTIASKESNLTLQKMHLRQNDTEDASANIGLVTKPVERSILPVSPERMTEPKAGDKILMEVSPHKRAEITPQATPDKSLEKHTIVTSPRKPSHTPEENSQSKSTRDMTDKTSDPLKATPLRRSRRLSTTSPSTPGTPKRSSKAVSNVEVKTPVRTSSEANEVIERITRSGRKILQVPTPLTKSKSTKRSVLVTPSRRSIRELADTEELQKISQKLDLSSRADDMAHEIPPTQHTLPVPIVTPTSPKRHKAQGAAETEVLVTPSRTRRRSGRKSISEETLETIVEENGKSTMPIDLEVEAELSLHLKTKTPIKGTPLKSTPVKTTPTRTRMSTRLSAAAESLEPIAEDVENSTHAPADESQSMKNISTDHHSVTRSKSPSRTRRKSIIGDTTVDIPEKKTPRKRRRSLAENYSEDSYSKDNLSSVEDKSESIISSESEQTHKQTDITRSTTRRTRRQSRSEEEHLKAEEIKVSSPMTRFRASVSDASQSSPDRMSTRSSGTTTLTSIKDSESSEEDDRFLKRRVSRRQSDKGHKLVNPVIEELSTRSRKSLRLTLSSTMSTTAQLHLQEQLSKPPRKSTGIKSLKLHSDSYKTASLLSPDSEEKVHARTSRKSRAASTSILLIKDSSNEDEMFLEGGMDSENEADDEANHPEVQESPELELNLLEVAGRGKGGRHSSLSRLSVGQTEKRKTLLPRRSLHTLKIHTGISKEQEEFFAEFEKTSTKRTRKNVRKSANTTVLTIESKIKPEMEEKDAEEGGKDVEEETKDVEEETKDNVFTETENESAVGLDEGMVEDHRDRKDKEMTKTDKEEKDESLQAPASPQFQFAKPKCVSTTRRVRALEYLTSEAVNFLFSPPQAAGRIIRHHAKIEEETRAISSESEVDSETVGNLH
nr:protein ELYS-like isoform X1 [Procambarus clarkii]